MEIYFDCEFDAVRDGEKHRQCVLSIGAINAQTQSEFYALVKPRKFKRVSYIVAKMTQLSDQDILRAPSFASVMKRFHDWTSVEKENVILYSFGPDDKRTILEHGAYEDYHDFSAFDHVVDLQKLLSETVHYEGKLVSPTLSLDDLKYVYEIEGDVVHNALNDAIDLMHIHQAYLQGKQPVPERIKEIMDRKLAKQEESKRKQEERMYTIIKERYAKYDQRLATIPFYPAVRELFGFLEEQEHRYHIRFLKKGMLVQDTMIPYDQKTVRLQWHILTEKPHLYVTIQGVKEEAEVPLTYRNVGIYEAIMKCNHKPEHETHTYANQDIQLKPYEPFMLEDMMTLFYDTIHTINKEDYDEEQLAVWAPKEYNEAGMQIRFCQSHTITAWKCNQLVGFGNLNPKGILDCLYVHKDEQQVHIGALLVQALEAYAKQQGLERIETQSSITARPFFTKLGYTTIKRNRVHRKKQMLINFIMRKSL